MRPVTSSKAAYGPSMTSVRARRAAGRYFAGKVKIKMETLAFGLS